MFLNIISSLALRSGERRGVGLFAFSSASLSKRSAASPTSTGIDFIGNAMMYAFGLLVWGL